MDDLGAAVSQLIELAVAEDIGPGDATSQAVLPATLSLRGYVRAKDTGVVAGLVFAEMVFARVDSRIRFTPRSEDGDLVVPGQTVAVVTGPAQGMLSAERIALNLLQHLSGVATLTRSFVDAVADTEAIILDTRKTHLGYRLLEKYAVRMGGGQNHRIGLYDMVLIKDNHIDAAGSITRAVECARSVYPDLPIEVEVKDMVELSEALTLSLDRIMLDNMNVKQMRRAVEVTAGRVKLEASGNVDLGRVTQIAGAGVDYISVGALTHSAPALDLSMKVSRSEGLEV